MKANGITCLDTWVEGDGALMLVLDCTADEALSMDTLTIDVTTDDGDLAERYVNYIKTCASVDAQTKRVTLRCAAATGDVAQTITQVVAKIGEVTQAAEAAGAAATEAKQTADEAKGIAEQGGTDPQLQALARAQVATMDLSEATCDEVIAFRDYWPEWQPDTAYKHNQPLTYQGRFFRTSKDLTSQAIYPPGSAESEYYEVTLAPNGIINWYNVGGEYNMVHKGEKRHYPDANGPVYEALENTSYSPDAYPQHWKLVEEAA